MGAEKEALRRAHGQLTLRGCVPRRPHRVGEIRRRADERPWGIYPLQVTCRAPCIFSLVLIYSLPGTLGVRRAYPRFHSHHSILSYRCRSAR